MPEIMSSEQFVSSSLGRILKSHVSLQGLGCEQCRRFIQARCRASHGHFVVRTFVSICAITQQMNILSSGNLNGAVTANVVCSFGSRMQRND